MKFGCTSCGLCCKMIGKVIENANAENTDKIRLAALKSFPYDVREDGSCSKLVNNKCTVYDKRPMVCNVDTMHEMTMSHLPKKAYYNLAATMCNKLMDDNNSKSDRVKWIRS